MDRIEESKKNVGNLSRRSFEYPDIIKQIIPAAILFHQQKYYYQ
jgi:hypothetical protein